MKTILTLAAAAAALATSSLAQASDRAGGHWEWQTRPAFGPNKSNLPSQVRVRVGHNSAAMANCNCDMMKLTAAGCMMNMPGKSAVPSAD